MFGKIQSLSKKFRQDFQFHKLAKFRNLGFPYLSKFSRFQFGKLAKIPKEFSERESVQHFFNSTFE